MMTQTKKSTKTKNSITSILLFTFVLFSCATSNSATTTNAGTNQFKTNSKTGSTENAIQYTDVVQTNNGKLRGSLSSDMLVEFYGSIPYATPPVKNLRWAEPVPVQNWDGVLDATHLPASAMQYRASSSLARIFDKGFKNNPAYTTPLSEDCLYLNIWKPASSKGENSSEKNASEKLPVLVFFHGGALIIGGSMEMLYNGECMAREQNIIMITVNYRLGIFGYLAHPELAKENANQTTGNYGLLDQILALKWIHDNIENFGGDKNNITIAGQSAGATSVNAICVSPLAKGLFTRAIAQSSSLVAKEPLHTFWKMEDAVNASQKLMKHFRVDSIEALRNVPAEKLVRYVKFIPGVTIDGYAVPENVYDCYKNGNSNETALLHGYNKDEARGIKLFIMLSRGKVTKQNYRSKLKDAVGENYKTLEEAFPAKSSKEADANYTTLVNIACFGYTHRNWSNMLAEKNVPVYEYYFSKKNESIKSPHKQISKDEQGYPYTQGFTGSMQQDNTHGSEIPYAYGNMKGTSYDASDYELRKIMMSYWANFARNGNPNASGLPEWEPFNKNKKLLEFGNKLSMIEDVHNEMYKLIDTLYE